MAIESKMARSPIGSRPTETKKKMSPWIWVIFVLVLAIAGGIWYAMQSGANDLTKGGETATPTIGSGEYQAVFLDNGQVYFGKLERRDNAFYALSDVFYLQSGAVGVDQVGNLALTKLGSEAHGPEDKMELNVDHILFIEDMKQDSKVVNAIRDYKSKKR